MMIIDHLPVEFTESSTFSLITHCSNQISNIDTFKLQAHNWWLCNAEWSLNKSWLLYLRYIDLISPHVYSCLLAIFLSVEQFISLSNPSLISTVHVQILFIYYYYYIILFLFLWYVKFSIGYILYATCIYIFSIWSSETILPSLSNKKDCDPQMRNISHTGHFTQMGNLLFVSWNQHLPSHRTSY